MSLIEFSDTKDCIKFGSVKSNLGGIKSKLMIKFKPNYDYVKQAKLRASTKSKAFDSANTTIKLYPKQIEHKERIIDIFKISPFAFDLSMLGTGKTYTSSAIYQEGGYENIVTIVPVSVKTKWKYMETEHGVKQYNSISFCELRSVRFKQPKHGFLVRKDYMATINQSDGTTREIPKCDFTCTSTYLDLVSKGLLLVIDEIQNIKNISDQLFACKELIRPIIDNFNRGGKSRVLLLSGSPIDKKIQTVHLYRCFGIMIADKLSAYNPYTGTIMWQGMEEIENYMSKHFGAGDVQCVRATYGEHCRVNDRDLGEYCYRLFQMILKQYLSHSMAPINIDAKIVKNNAFYDMPEDEMEILIKGIEMLKSVTRFDRRNGTVDHGNNGIAALRKIQRALTIIETSKIQLMVRVAKAKLASDPKMKVVICVNYTETINDLARELGMYGPLILDGRVSANNRLTILQKFQTPSTDYRLLIGNISVCSTGIDLDDQHGEYKRFCIVNPNYSTITLYQLSHRFHRSNTKSDSVIHFIFGKGDTLELPILNALAKKGQVMKETTELQVQGGIVFPGDYDSWYEP